jgi:hypothetical protein
MLGDSESGGLSVSRFDEGIRLEQIVIIDRLDVGCWFGVAFLLLRRTTIRSRHTLGFFVFATLLELRIVLGGVEEVLAAFCGECNTISFECMHPGNGVFEKVSLDKLKGSAGSDGNTHIRVREEQF